MRLILQQTVNQSDRFTDCQLTSLYAICVEETSNNCFVAELLPSSAVSHQHLPLDVVEVHKDAYVLLLNCHVYPQPHFWRMSMVSYILGVNSPRLEHSVIHVSGLNAAAFRCIHRK